MIRLNLPTRTAEYARVAELLGADTKHLTTSAAANQAIEKVVELQRALNIPQRLRDVGVTQEQLSILADRTMGIRRLLRLNPRPVRGEDVLAVLGAAL